MKKSILVLLVSLLMIAPVCSVNAETTEEAYRRYEENLMKSNPQYAQHKQQAEDNKRQLEAAMKQLENAIQPELDYYEKLKTCTPSVFDGDKLSMQTYGLKDGGMCNFDLKLKSHQMTKVLCNINAPVSEVRQFAENKIKMANSLTGKQNFTSADYTEIMNQLTLFSNKYCK